MDRSFAQMPAALVAVTMLAACSGSEQPPVRSATEPEPAANAAIPGYVELSQPALTALRTDFDSTAAEARYFASPIDLDGDGRDELIVHVAGPAVCGTGGCNTVILAPQGEGYRMVADISITNPPIRVADSRTHGWRDLIVEVGGGGGPSGPVLLRYDGEHYPEDPSDRPAERLAAVPPASRTVVAPFDSFAEGRPLFGPASTTAAGTE